MAMDYCCEAMWKQFEVETDDERLVFFQKEHREFGLIDRKDPTSYTPIAFCPWCGRDILSARWKAMPGVSQRESKTSEEGQR